MADQSNNFYSSLETALSPKGVADLFGAAGWCIRRCGWNEYEVIGPDCELVIEVFAESGASLLMHGVVAQTSANLDTILGPLRSAGVAFKAEWYGADGELLQECNE
jgi:hypothetical protein